MSSTHRTSQLPIVGSLTRVLGPLADLACLFRLELIFLFQSFSRTCFLVQLYLDSSTFCLIFQSLGHAAG